MESEDFLEHHGVKGMKWGRRKKRQSIRNINKGVKSYKARRKVREKQALADKKAGKKLTSSQRKTLAARSFRRDQNIGWAIAGGLGATYFGMRHKRELMEVLRMAAVSVAKSRQAREGAKATATILKEVGANRTASLTLVDGVWKLVN
jgi:hypothetical protein